MAKIFVSYKHHDTSVRPVENVNFATARTYVDILGRKLSELGHTFKGEENGVDLSGLSEERIEELLRDKMYDSSVTIALISKNMKENKTEKEQWIPWEISYSLKEKTREDRTSHTNAILAVVIPDEYGSYDYFVSEHNNCLNRCRIWKKENSPYVFEILTKNMFNRKEPNLSYCSFHGNFNNGTDHSYIYPVKWDEFFNNIDGNIAIATRAKENINDYLLEVRL